MSAPDKSGETDKGVIMGFVPPLPRPKPLKAPGPIGAPKAGPGLPPPANAPKPIPGKCS
jgi:hypothetical protein